MTRFVSFQVIGEPAPQGSKRAIVNQYTGKPAMVESSKKVRPWRADVKEAATRAWGEAPAAGAIALTLTFRFTRPKGHFGTRGNVLPSAPDHKITKPDIDKLARSTMDALTGIVFRDDSQVVDLHPVKVWATENQDWTGCQVEVELL